MTYEEFAAAVQAQNDVKLCNLSEGQYISVERYNRELKEAKDTIRGLTEAAKAYEGVDVEALKGQIETLKSKYDTDMQAMRIDQAILQRLTEEGARDPKMIAHIIDRKGVKLEGESVKGLDEQLNNLHEKAGYLFNVVSTRSVGGTQEPVAGSGNGSGGYSAEDIGKMSMAEYKAYREKIGD